MTKKIVRNRESYIKNWTAAITGSVLLLASQAAAQADEGRQNFRSFRDANPGFDRHTLRQMFRQEMGRPARGGASNGVAGISPVPGIPTPQVQNVPGVVEIPTARSDRGRWANKLERDGVLKQSVQANGNGKLVNLSGGVNLDLTSQVRNITLGQKLFNGVQSVEIHVNGETKTLTAGSQVTAAEYIAAKQVLAGSAQKVVIGAGGIATGGEVDLSAISARGDVMRASDLTVPVNVTTLGDFAKSSAFKLQGDLNNFGTVHAFDSDGRGRGGMIHADDITNNANALISSDVDLTLRANGQLTNLGTITSNGNLTLSSSDIKNSGNISSAKNVNLDTSSAADLNVNNTGGTISAADSINVRSAGYGGSNNTNLTGGDWLSNTLNLNAGGGTVTAALNDVTGNVNSNGYAVHFGSNTETLNIGDTNLIDPTFYNFGNINFTGSLHVAADLTIIATGNITDSSFTAFTISTNGNGSATNGGNLTMIAGANITNVVGTASPSLPTGNAGSQVTINGGSINGGSILIGPVNINTSGSAGGSGGNVLLAAFQGVAAGSGTVDLTDGAIISGSNITTGGNGAGNNGDVVIIAANGIDTSFGGSGTINTTGGTGFGGNVVMVTAQPTTNGPLTYNADGSVQSGSLSVSSSLNPTGTIDVANVNSRANIILTAGNNLTTANLTSVGATQLSAGVSNGTAVSPGAVLTLNGDINSGSIVSLTTANDLVQNNNNDVTAVGNITIDVGSTNASAPGGADYTQNGSLSSGGSIQVNVGDAYTIGNGAGDTVTAVGDVNIATGLISNNGTLTQNAAITAGGTATSDGSVTLNVFGNYNANSANGDINAGQGLGSYTGGIVINARGISTNTGANLTGRNVTLIGDTSNGASFDLDGAVIANLAGGGTATLVLNGTNAANITDASVSGGIQANQITIDNNTVGGSISILNTGTNINFINMTATADQNVTLVESEAGGRDGNINFTGVSSAENGTFTVLVDHNITGSAGSLIAGVNGSLTSNGSAGVGNIGVDANNRLAVDFDNLTVNALGGPSAVAGNAFIDGLFDLNFNTSQVVGTLDVNATGDLTSSGVVTGGTIILNSELGDIGNGADDQFLTSVGAGGITANAATGDVNLFNFGSGSVNSSTANGTFNLSSTDDLTVTGNISATDTSVDAINGDLTIDAGVTINGSNSIFIGAGDDIVAGAGSKITGGALTVDFADAGSDTPVTLTTAVDSIATANGSSLTINEDDGISIGIQQVSELNVNAGLVANGLVDTTADVSVAVLNVTNVNGDIEINNDLTATTSASFSTVGGTGSITQGNADASISTPTLSLQTDSGNIGSFFNPIVVDGIAGTDITVDAQSSAGGDVNVAYQGAGTITVGPSSGNGNFVVLSDNGGDIDIDGDISGSGSAVFSTDTLSFNANYNVDFTDVVVTSDTGLTVNGDGTFTSDASGEGVEFIANDGSIITNGQLNFNGGNVALTLANNDGINAVINNGTLNGDNSTNTLTITSRVFTPGTITNFAQVNIINGNTIINTTGDVTLPANLIFQGESLAIIAAGNVTATGAVLIDLSSATGDAGDLLILAGVDATPVTVGQEQSDQPFTITGFNATGGNVNLSGLNIDTTSATSFGGDVFIYANGGTTNAGTVVTGNITTTGALAGGDVLIGGEGGVTVGNINTVGSELDGDIFIGVGTVSIVGPLVITDGVVTSGGLAPVAITAGNIVTGNINAGSGDIDLAGGFGTANTISTGDITGGALEIDLVDGSASLANTNIAEFAADSTGTANTANITLANQVGDLVLADILGTGLDVNITASGAITAGGTIDVGTGDVALTSTQVGGDGIVVDGTVDANDITLTAATSNVAFNNDVTAVSDVTLVLQGVTQTDGRVGAANLVLDVDGAIDLDTAIATLADGTYSDLTLRNTGALSLGAITAGGAVNVSNTGGTLTAAGIIDADGIVTLDSGDSLNVNAAITSDLGVNLFADDNIAVNANVTAVDGELSIIADAGNITTAANITIQGDDFILIQAAGGGNINIGAGNTIFTDAKVTGEGDIAILQGGLPARTKRLRGRNITSVEIDGEVITGRGRGTKKVIFQAPDNILTALGADLLIKASSKNGVIIGGGATITADPPVAAGTPVRVTTWNGNSASSQDSASTFPASLASLASAAGLSAPAAVASVNLLSTANATVGTTNATSANGRDTLGNLATANTLSMFAGQEDDSTIVSYTPMGMIVDGKVCSDIEFGFANDQTGNSVSTIKHSDCVTLNNGSALFIPSKNMTVVTPKGSIRLDANAVAFVTVDDNQLSVYDINDQHKGSVVVATGGRDMALSPGRHLVVTHDRAATFADANPIESIMHRSVTSHDLGSGKRVFTSEFSIPSAVQIVKPLSAMMKAENAAAKKVAQNVIKTSAVMMHLSGSTPFEFHAKPKTVALKW